MGKDRGKAKHAARADLSFICLSLDSRESGCEPESEDWTRGFFFPGQRFRSLFLSGLRRLQEDLQGKGHM